MLSLRSLLVALGLVGVSLSPLVAGCGAGEEGGAALPEAETGDEEEVVPADAKTLWDQVDVCDKIIKRHSVIRANDYKDGVIRWNCADVPGVSGTDYGQEYCEYNAVSQGKLVKKLSDVAPGAPIQCLFTSIYQDAFKSSADVSKYTKALADKANLGVQPPVAAVQMQVGFNSRGAATALVVDCHSQASAGTQLFDHDAGKFRDKTQAEKDEVARRLTEESRQAACWQASVASPANATKLRAACRTDRSKVLTEARWKKAQGLGAKVLAPGEAGYDDQRVLAACLGSWRSGAVTWRNSDNLICERVTRASAECSCSYGAIPQEFLGFTFGGWTSGTAVPAGCRFAKVDGKDNPNLVICELSSGQRSDLELEDRYVGDLQAMCHDYFSTEIVMSAPVRLLEQKGSCKLNAGFCSSYEGK